MSIKIDISPGKLMLKTEPKLLFEGLRFWICPTGLVGEIKLVSPFSQYEKRMSLLLK